MITQRGPTGLLPRAAQLCAAPDLEPQLAASRVRYYFACGSKPVSLDPLGDRTMADLQIQLRRDIERFGWHILNVFSTNDHPPHSYSVGLFRTFKHPEIVIVGLPGQTAQTLINDVGAEIKRSHRFAPGERSSHFLNGYEVAFVDVAEALYGDYFGQAIDYYGSRAFPVLQFVWPDRDHRFPWDEGYDASLRSTQPILSSYAEQSPN